MFDSSRSNDKPLQGKAVTIKMISERCCVCRQTVHRALKGMSDVSSETAERIRLTALEMGYQVPDISPQEELYQPRRQQQSATLRMVAERAGVGVITASRAMKNDIKVKPDTTALVHKAAKELGYNPAHQKNARQLLMQRHGISVLNKIIGIFFPPHFSIDYYFLGQIFDGAMTEAMNKQFSLVTSYDHYLEPSDKQNSLMLNSLPTVYSYGDVDAAIIFSDAGSNRNIIKLLRQEVNFGNRPVTTILSKFDYASAILVDDYGGEYAAVEHLLNLGHRSILHFWVGTEWNYQYSRRHEGCLDALKYHQVDHTKCLYNIGIKWNWDYMDLSMQYVTAYLRSHPEVTAILALNDRMAVFMFDALQEAGFRIPQDISLIGFDDIHAIRRKRIENILTTVRVPLVELGAEACRLIINQAMHNSTEYETVILPTELIIRGTTSKPNKRKIIK
jgi:LacI family transcriptional regulator